MLIDALLKYIKLRDHERWRDFVWRFSVCVTFAMQRFENGKMLAFIWGKLERVYGFRMQPLPPRPRDIAWCQCSFCFFLFKVNTAKRAHSEARGRSCSGLRRAISRVWAGMRQGYEKAAPKGGFQASLSTIRASRRRSCRPSRACLPGRHLGCP